MKTSTFLSMTIVLAGLSTAVSANPVTIVARGTITHINNLEQDWHDEIIGPAIDPALIPFQVGDELRIVLMYDSSTTGQFYMGCNGGTGTWSFFNAVRAIASVGGITLTSTDSTGFIGLSDCVQNSTTGDAVQWSGSATGGQISDLPATHYSVAYASTASNWLNGPSLPTVAPDPLLYPISRMMSEAELQWRVDMEYPNRNLRYVSAYALDGNITIEQVSDTASVGSNVVVAPNYAGGGMVMTFDSVTDPGDVNIVSFGPTDPDVPLPPSAFDFGGSIFDVVTTAQFSGNVEICLPWSDSNVQPTMLHYTNGAWEVLPVTASGSGTFCAKTTSFSLFALAIPGAAQRNLQTLVAALTNLNLKKGLSNSLDAKLSAAKKALSDMKNNNDVAAGGSMSALLNEVAAQRGTGLTDAEADGLIVLANSVISHL